MRVVFADKGQKWGKSKRITARIIFIFVAFFAVIMISGFAVGSNAPVIVIDPGHGGQDSGAVGITGVYEKDLNLQMAEVLKEHFENAGYKVVMTRTEDSDTDGKDGFDKTSDIVNRQKICESYGENALFLMVHMNASTSSNDKGFQVFYGTGNVDASLSLAQNIYNSIADAAMVTRLREVKEAPKTVYLCKNVKVPCVLIECGFITNSADTAFLCSEEYRKDLAYVIFNGVQTYLNPNNSSVVE